MAPSVVDCAHKSSNKNGNKKRLVICNDGTWNSANDLGSGPPTNVSRLSGAVAHKCCSGMPQIVYYHPGAGTEASRVAQVLGGTLGLGVAGDIVESYRFICDNYNPGDEIVIIGFSRGAFTARSVGAMVCALGFLNRPGLDQLPHIFHDYETWQKWNTMRFSEKDHLAGITLENVKRLRRFKAANARNASVVAAQRQTEPKFWELWDEAQLAAQLRLWKEGKFQEMAKMTQIGDDGKPSKIMDLRKMAHEYRNILADFQLSLCERQTEDRNSPFVPVLGRVKAIGVWDTVGSLGIPEIPPFYHAGRGEREIRFESLDVHPRVENAFHAIALDEWRTAFDCTMWGKRGNSETNLRQVWFPGTHCNVGGGWEDQQIATIALAWMADQLTSVGVEFNKTEMSRIFYELRPEAKARPWGLGLLRNPNGATSYPDWLWSCAAAPYRKLTGSTTDYLTRTPGQYKEDNAKKKLISPNELIHPCVRIRYLYGGLNMDDAGPWNCRSLTEHGYVLQRHTKTPPPPFNPSRKPRIDSAFHTYHSVRGPLALYFDSLPAVLTEKGAGTDAHPFVKIEQPHEDDLHPLPDIPASEGSASYWVWALPDEKAKLTGNDHMTRVLPEEHIGMWERMYIKINQKLVTWQEKRDGPALPPPKPAQGVWGSIKSAFGAGESELPPIKAVQLKDKFIPEAYGYHDVYTWQRGDMQPKPEKK